MFKPANRSKGNSKEGCFLCLLKIICMMPVELDQNNRNFFEAFKPVFIDGLCDLKRNKVKTFSKEVSSFY